MLFLSHSTSLVLEGREGRISKIKGKVSTDGYLLSLPSFPKSKIVGSENLLHFYVLKPSVVLYKMKN